MSREVRGPGIAGIAMIAKPPPLLPPEHRIYEMRADNVRRQQYQDVLDSNGEARRRAMFEANTDRRIREKRVESRVNQIMTQQESALDARRSKLRAMLQAEEGSYVTGAEALQETPIEKMARMRQTVKSLRENRESERLDVAQTKQDQAWRANCDALRTATSRQEHMMVEESRRSQLDVKRDIEHQEAEVDQYYADLWAQDIAVKGAREAQETEKRAAFNADLQHSQIRQMEGVEDFRQRGLKLKAEQQRLRLEEAALMEDERIRTLNNKRMAQDRFRRTLDRDAELRATHASTNMNEEMQSDLDLLNRIEAGQKQAAKDAHIEKCKLAQETADYHAYLRDMEARRHAHEATFDAACHDEMVRAQRKQNAEWRAQREKRRAMMDDVIVTRRAQIRARQQAILQERADVVTEGERIEVDVEAHGKEQQVIRDKQAVFHQTYGAELGLQMRGDAQRLTDERQAMLDFEAELSASSRATDLRVTQELTSLMSISGTNFGK